MVVEVIEKKLLVSGGCYFGLVIFKDIYGWIRWMDCLKVGDKV